MRIDVLETINRNSPDELDADSLEETLSGMTPWSRQTLNQIMTRYIHVVSGGKLRYKTPIRLADYLFGLGDDWLRSHWHLSPFRFFYRSVYHWLSDPGKYPSTSGWQDAFEQRVHR